MKHFVQGEDRTQSTLLPEMLDDFVSENNPVRVVDVFLDHLDLAGLGIDGAEPEVTGLALGTIVRTIRKCGGLISSGCPPSTSWAI